MDRRAQHRQRGQGRDTSIPASAIAQWAKDNPLDAAALATSPVPILGDIVGGAADLKGLLDNPSFANAGLLAAGMLPFVPAGTVKRMGEGLLSGGGGLKAAAIRYKGKTFTGKTHSEALAKAESALGEYIPRDMTKHGFIDSSGKYLSRDSQEAALEAISADQFTDKILQEITMGEIKRGEPVTLIAEGLRFADNLPTDEASRMARAREMGFDVDVFHGTGGNVEGFDKSKLGSVTKAQSAKNAVWVSESPDTAAGYAENAANQQVQNLIDASYAAERSGDFDKAEQIMRQAEELEQTGVSGANVMPLKIRGNFKEFDAEGLTMSDLDESQLSTWVDEAKKGGFDGVKILNFSDEADYGVYRPTTHYGIFEPKNIRSKFAKFDPAKKDSANLTAAVGGLGLTGLLGSRLMGEDEEEY